jgi:hypothetical protein
MIKVLIKNSTSEEGVFFLRGKDITGLYTTSDYTENIVGNKLYDCMGGLDSEYTCVDNDHTIFKKLQPGEYMDLFLKKEDNISSAVVWFVPSSSTNDMSKGPNRISQAEFDISRTLFYDITNVEAVSSGLKMTWKPIDTQDMYKAECVPRKPKQLQVQNPFGFNVVSSDKYTAVGAEDTILAGCPESLVENAAGQHLCRKFYAEKYTDPDSYCGWLEENKCQAYCWSMDEWKCTDETCGYGGENQPKNVELNADLTVKDPNNIPNDFPANTYSCGKDTDLQIPGGNKTDTWWPKQGCKDKTVDGKPTLMVQQRLDGGTFEIEFIGLDWLNGAGPVNSQIVINVKWIGIVIACLLLLSLIVYIAKNVSKNGFYWKNT